MGEIRAAAGLTIVAAALALASCTDSGRTIVAPPEIPGAEFVGSEDCELCHPYIAEELQTSTHAVFFAEGDKAAYVGCESCHGPGSLHVESGGERKTIINPERTAEPCFHCHLDLRGEFALPHSHPVTGGPLSLTRARMSCSDCHAAHKGKAITGGGTEILSQNETCFECHEAQRGPYVFEHEAMLEGCTACHNPHGSVNAALLTERNATLCLKCHFQEQTAPGVILIGGRDHSFFLGTGTCWSAGCHEAVHGSQVNSSLRF